MSTATLTDLLPDLAPSEAPERHLRPLDRPAKRRRPRVTYAITAVVGAIVIGLVQLGMSIATTQTTYDIRDLTTKQRSLTLQSQALYDEVAGLGSPQYLAANAAALGMVVGGSPVYLRLSDGAVVGTTGDEGTPSTIDPAGRPLVKNALIADTPLVTDPGRTIAGQTAPAKGAAPAAADGETPVEPPADPVVTGIPNPQTH